MKPLEDTRDGAHDLSEKAFHFSFKALQMDLFSGSFQSDENTNELEAGSIPVLRDYLFTFARLFPHLSNTRTCFDSSPHDTAYKLCT